MAMVFLVHDVRHHQRVALKVIREDLAAGMGAERFLREIQLAVGLRIRSLASQRALGMAMERAPLASSQTAVGVLVRRSTMSPHAGQRSTAPISTAHVFSIPSSPTALQLAQVARAVVKSTANTSLNNPAAEFPSSGT
jgi:hypothetical protein